MRNTIYGGTLATPTPVAKTVTDLGQDPSTYTHEQYPSAKATADYINSTNLNLHNEIERATENLRNAISSKANKTELESKEDKGNKITEITDPHDMSAEEYPTANAVFSFVTNQTAPLGERVWSLSNQLDTKADKSQIGDIETALDNKVDKEDGKTLYRSMELIYEYPFSGNEQTDLIRINKDKNGENFILDEVLVYVDYGAQITTTDTFDCYNNGGTDVGSCMFYIGANAKGRYYQAYAKRCTNGFWFAQAYETLKSERSYGSFNGARIMSSIDYIKSLDIDMGIIQAGAKVRVYGRRVD